jgi:hypothetical protein
MFRRGSSSGWQSIELTPRQLARLARHLRKYRRQVADPDLLFWCQRVLADAQFPVST